MRRSHIFTRSPAIFVFFKHNFIGNKNVVLKKNIHTHTGHDHRVNLFTCVYLIIFISLGKRWRRTEIILFCSH